MTEYKGRRVFRSPSWFVGIVAVTVLLFAGGTWIAYDARGLHPLTLASAVLTVIGALAVIEVVVDRVVLTDDALHVIRIWARRTYAKTDIVRVTSEKGVPMALQLADGRWAKLPPVDASPNSIRAWLRATDRDTR